MNDCSKPARLETKLDRVFYDGACPLCSREIEGVRKGGAPLSFINVHNLSEKGDQCLPAAPDKLLKELHVLTASGALLVGLDANIYMWKHSGQRLKSAFFSSPGINGIARLVYQWWSKKRYSDLYDHPGSKT